MCIVYENKGKENKTVYNLPDMIYVSKQRSWYSDLNVHLFPVAHFTEKVNPNLGKPQLNFNGVLTKLRYLSKPQLNFNGGLAKLGLTPLAVKYATGHIKLGYSFDYIWFYIVALFSRPL